MNEVTVYLIRHGQTDYNKQGIVQGSGIDAPLNSTGMGQAKAFYEYYKNMAFEAFYASNLRRSQDTLSCWKSAGKQINIEAGIREFSWGELEGVRPTPTQKELFDNIRSSWALGNLEERVSGGENPLEAWERAKPFFLNLPQKYPGKSVLVCSHGRQIRVVLSALLDGSISKMEHYEQPNTCLHILSLYGSGQAKAIKLADTSHLDAYPEFIAP